MQQLFDLNSYFDRCHLNSQTSMIRKKLIEYVVEVETLSVMVILKEIDCDRGYDEVETFPDGEEEVSLKCREAGGVVEIQNDGSVTEAEESETRIDDDVLVEEKVNGKVDADGPDFCPSLHDVLEGWGSVFSLDLGTCV